MESNSALSHSDDGLLVHLYCRASSTEQSRNIKKESVAVVVVVVVVVVVGRSSTTSRYL